MYYLNKERYCVQRIVNDWFLNCSASLPLKYKQQGATLSRAFYLYNCSACFRLFLRPPSGAQKCTYNIRYCQANTAVCCYRGWDGTQAAVLLCMFQAVPPLLSYFRDTLAMHGHTNVKFVLEGLLEGIYYKVSKHWNWAGETGNYMREVLILVLNLPTSADFSACLLRITWLGTQEYKVTK
jgi:hypothetical protein